MSDKGAKLRTKDIATDATRSGAIFTTAWVVILALSIVVLVKSCMINTEVADRVFVASVLCDDENPCTVDGYDEDGRCVHSFMPMGHACASPCGSVATCVQGECVPIYCDGSCETAADCPDFWTDYGTGSQAVVEARCLSGICIYATFSNETGFTIFPDAQNALVEQVCGKSAMTLTGRRSNHTGVLDFDGDNTGDNTDTSTAFDTLDQAQQQAISTINPGPVSVVLSSPSYLSGWTRTLQQGTCCQGASYPRVSVSPSVLADDVSAPTITFESGAMPVNSLIGTVEWVPPSSVDLSNLRYLSGYVHSPDAPLGARIVIEVEDGSSNTAQSTVYVPIDNDFVQWYVDLDAPSFDRSTVSAITISVTCLISGNTVYVRDLHFLPDTPLTGASINQCMYHVPKHTEGEDTLHCVHWYQCACASASLQSVPVAPTPSPTPSPTPFS